MTDQHHALRSYLRSSKAHDLMEQVIGSDDPVWAEDEMIRDLLSPKVRVEAPDETDNDDDGMGFGLGKSWR